MDIHIPKTAGHGWRELVREVAIIVLGVLIALGAEQIVQSIDRGDDIRAAEDAMRSELSTDDGPQLYTRYRIHRCIDQTLSAIREAAERGQSRAALRRLIAQYRVPFWTWDSLAFAATNSSDVALHMSSGALRRWSTAYAVMPTLNTANAREYGDGAELVALARTGGALSVAERTTLLHAVETLRRDNGAIFSAVRFALPAMHAAGIEPDPIAMRRMADGVAQSYPAACLVEPPAG